MFGPGDIFSDHAIHLANQRATEAKHRAQANEQLAEEAITANVCNLAVS